MTGMVHEIVAGCDGSPDSLRALDWAVWEARARGVVLTVCHAWAPGHDVSPGYGVAAETARRERTHVLAEGMRRAQPGLAPGSVQPLLVALGPAARVLCEHSRDATMTVVGARGRGGLTGLPLGSVGLQVAGHASGPVTVVRGHIRPVPGHQPGPVVVGADGSEAAEGAVAFAFEEAALRDVPLLAVCALADSTAVLGGERRVKADFERALGKSEADHPEVTVRRVLAHGTPRTALLEAASPAQLLVVGARGRGGLRGMVLGSVSLAILHYAHCPVSVIRQR
jgi:nucleotide-binding universal stress UspA family protein